MAPSFVDVLVSDPVLAVQACSSYGQFVKTPPPTDLVDIIDEPPQGPLCLLEKIRSSIEECPVFFS